MLQSERVIERAYERRLPGLVGLVGVQLPSVREAEVVAAWHAARDCGVDVERVKRVVGIPELDEEGR